MHETKPKINLQVMSHLQIHRGIQNPAAKHLKWYRKERLEKNNYGPEPFPKDITTCFTVM